MLDVLTSEKTDANTWVPDEEDLTDERMIFIAYDMTHQGLWPQAEEEMDPTSVERMKQGLEPTILEDKVWVGETPR